MLCFSAYQVIVLKVADGIGDLPSEYASNLKKTNNASEANLNFYIAAEVSNSPVREASWEFTVGDERDYGAYLNKKLERGKVYIVYQRAITRHKSVS